MLSILCEELKNWDFNSKAIKHFGVFKIESGSVAPLDFLQDGQYFRIVGSVFNDGVYQYPCYDLIDEVFDGSIWAMKIPPEIIDLSNKIKEFVEKDENIPSNYVSESYGNYSYTKVTDENGVTANWKTVFSKELNRWRKI